MNNTTTNFKIGTVTHYYDKIGVAIIKLISDISVGEKIMFERGGEALFEQTIDSIQVEHNKIDTAKKGDTIGLKVTQPVKEAAEVYKIT